MDGVVENCAADGSRVGDLAVFDPAVLERAKEIIADGTVENIKRAYQSDFGYYIVGARASGLSCELPIPSPDHPLGFCEGVGSLRGPCARM